jgi:hypothetical protein
MKSFRCSSFFCVLRTSHLFQFLRERERRTLLRERARAEKEEGDADEDDEDDDYEDDDEEEEEEEEDNDEPGFSCGGDSRELRDMASAGALLRQALKKCSALLRKFYCVLQPSHAPVDISRMRLK